MLHAPVDKDPAETRQECNSSVTHTGGPITLSHVALSPAGCLFMCYGGLLHLLGSSGNDTFIGKEHDVRHKIEKLNGIALVNITS